MHNAAAQASVSLQGAQLLEWQPHGQHPVIWLSPRARFAPGHPIRGGVPLCWPWFGAHPANPQAATHGLARTVHWELDGCTAHGPQLSEVRLSLNLPPDPMAGWAHAARAELCLRIGADLEMNLTTHNTGHQALVFSEALHTYFEVGDIEQVRLLGLEHTEYLDKLQGFLRCHGTGPVTFGAETDRVYVNTPAECVIEDPLLRRRIHISKTGSLSTVVWNPGPHRARQLDDLGENGHRHMLCVESGNAHDNTLTLPPGHNHTLSVRIRVEAC